MKLFNPIRSPASPAKAGVQKQKALLRPTGLQPSPGMRWKDICLALSLALAAPIAAHAQTPAQWYSEDDDVFELAKRNYNRLGHLAIRLLIGTQDVSFPDSEKLHVHLRDLGVAHEYEILLGVSHNTQQYYDRAGIHGFQFQAAGFTRARN